MQIHPTVFRVHQTLKKALAQYGSQTTYVLAVSGGADSMALAHAAAVLGKEASVRFVVCHVEHGLRGAEALRDLELVHSFCIEQGLPFVERHVDVQALVKKEHLSVEDAARKLRYAALQEVAASEKAVIILTAHHADDQAETVLLKLLRGAGSEGLSGMREYITTVTPDTVVSKAEPRVSIGRPFLNLTRKDLKEYCHLEQIPYCHDSTNDDINYTRNRIRQQLLPLLEREYNAKIRATLVRTACQLAEDSDCLAQLAEGGYQKSLADDADGKIVFNSKQLCEYPAALQKRILRLAFFKLGGRELSYERTQALYGLVTKNEGGKVIQLPDGITATCANKKIIFAKNG